jgi:glycosyltransferase involved in cell wall biosynthesis
VKAYDRLIESFAACLQSGSVARPAYLVVCGSGTQREALEARAASLGVADRVRFAGWTDRPLDYYRLFDVFALSSISEGAPMSLMEAMAAGAAPVATDVGAIAQILGPELAGQLAPPGDIAAYARVLGATLRSAAHSSGIGERARARIVANYDFDRMIDAYRDLYQNLAR